MEHSINVSVRFKPIKENEETEWQVDQNKTIVRAIRTKELLSFGIFRNFRKFRKIEYIMIIQKQKKFLIIQ